MGLFFSFILLIITLYLIFKLLKRLFLGWLFRPPRPNNRQKQNYQKPKAPESQEDRILEYQKKNFEKADAEDVEFEEIKNNKPNQ